MICRIRHRVICLALICLPVGLVAIAADDAKPAVPAAEATAATSRTIYVSRHAGVRDLADWLGQHYEGDAGVKVVAEPNANLLSIRTATAAQMDEVLKTIAMIDRPQRLVAFRVFLVQFNTKKEGVEIESPDVETEELSGPPETVMATLRAWTTAGKIAVIRQFQLTVPEGRASDLMLGETKPVVTAFTSNASTGVATPVLTMRHVGTTINLKPRISDTGVITVDAALMDSRLQPTEQGVELAKGRNGPIVVQGVALSRMQVTLTIPDGQSAVAADWKTNPAAEQVPSIVVVSARIVDPNNPRKLANKPVEPENGVNPAAPGPVAERRPGGRGGFSLRSQLSSSLRDPEVVRRLNWTAEQQEKFDQLRKQTFQNRPRPEDLPTFIQDFEQKTFELLTDEQKKIWAERQEELKKAAPDGPLNPVRPARPIREPAIPPGTGTN